MNERPVWIGDALPAFGLYHAPEVPVADAVAVLFCSPFGWDDMASYPVRRTWARALAAAGHPVLRFDLPGTGQSAGAPREPDQLASWLRAVGDAASWLRATSGAQRLAAVGIGMGGLLALQAAADGAPVDDLVLWGNPASGRHAVRAARAFARLQTSAGEDPALPDGWLQSGGYVMSAQTLADVARLRPDGSAPGTVKRALLLAADALPSDDAFAVNLRDSGVAVTSASGPGYGASLQSPEFSVAPEAVMAAVAAWLGEEATATGESVLAEPVARDHLELEIDGVVVRERALHLPGPEGALFGILAEPVDKARSSPCVVLLPAWAERCSGPNRVWTEVARRHAARGTTVLRIDLAGIGDSDGDKAPLLDLTSQWLPTRIVQVTAALDALEQGGHGPRFLLAGLCTGGYWALRAAAGDPRVAGALVINGSPPRIYLSLLEAHDARKLARGLNPVWYLKALRGEVDFAGVRLMARGIAGRGRALRARGRARAARAVARRRGRYEPPPAAEVDQLPTVALMLDRLEQHGAAVTFAYGIEEPGLEHIAREGLIGKLDRWPHVRLIELDSEDHNLRRVCDQVLTHELFDAFLDAARTREPAPVQ